MGFLNVGRCEYCDQLLVVMNTSRNSVLPVEVENRNVLIDENEEFNSKKYKSHLLSCSKQQEAWPLKKLKYIKQRNPLAKILSKDLQK